MLELELGAQAQKRCAVGGDKGQRLSRPRKKDDSRWLAGEFKTEDGGRCCDCRDASNAAGEEPWVCLVCEASKSSVEGCEGGGDLMQVY